MSEIPELKPVAVPSQNSHRRPFTVSRLDEPIENAFGKPMVFEETSLTLRVAILATLTTYRTTALQALEVFELARKFRTADQLTFTESEWALFKSIIESNPASFPAVVLAQLYRMFL